MDFIYFLRVLYKRKWIFIVCSIIAVMATFLITKEAQKEYKSTTIFETGILSNNKPTDENSNNYIQPQKIESKFNSLIETFYSRAVINLLSYRLILHDLESEEPFRDIQPFLDQLNGDKEIEEAKEFYQSKLENLDQVYSETKEGKYYNNLLESVSYNFESIRDWIEIKRVQGTDYLKVSIKSENPNLSAWAVNTYSEEFLKYYETGKVERSDNYVHFYTDLVEKKKKELSAKSDSLKQFKLKNGIVNIKEQTSSLVSQIRQLEILREEKNQQIPSYQGTIDKIESGDLNSSNASMEKLKADNRYIQQLKKDINELNQRYLATNKTDREVGARLEEKRRELQQMIKEQAKIDPEYLDQSNRALEERMKESKLELGVARQSVASIDREIRRLKGELEDLVEKEATVSALEREISVASEEYVGLVNKLNNAKFSSLNSGNQLMQIELGRPPEKPEPTKSLILSAFSGAVTFSFLVLLFFVIEYLDFSIKTPTKFKAATKLNLLGYLNTVREQPSIFDVLENPADSKDKEHLSQMMRKIRFEIENLDKKKILITSNRKGEGKSFFMVALAYYLHLNDHKVVVIDSNLKNRDLTDFFESQFILEHYFDGKAELPELIQSTKYNNFDFIGSHSGDISPFELGSRKKFEKLFNSLSEQYDFILFEGASNNDYSDTKELAEFSDAVLAVFSADSILNQTDKESIAYYNSMGEKFIGAVLNKVQLSDLRE